ncbi:hypothetical protein PIIN_07773 [Serendipita indica DSM 11827]|uniref:Pentacotripeptide-repeat region of PRORP domain-containing protein n=1 Tax=Serendipita indica (strain DSM 11827) TaxID=1109443 RepID=G4TR76_SERID|nr:hypothetical protein PIIN_07773 [Serendipita indica DSM 11827]
MIPKAATTLFHFTTARVAAAVQTGTQTITPSLINAFQHQPQQQLANAASNATTSLGWSAGASGATSSASSNAASAKFNAGGRFYNAYQQATQDPSFAAQDDEERRKRKQLARRASTARPLHQKHHQLIRRNPNNALISIPPSRLVQARLLQTKSYPGPHYRPQRRDSEETVVDNATSRSSSRALVRSPKAGHLQRYYATSATDSPSSLSAEGVETALDLRESGSSAGSLVDEHAEQAMGMSQSDAELYEGSVAENNEALFEMIEQDAAATLAESATDPSSPQSVLPPTKQARDVRQGGQFRHPSLQAIYELARGRSQAEMAGEWTSQKADSAVKQLERHIQTLRKDGVSDSTTWSYVLWAVIVLRRPMESLHRAIGLYNDLLSGSFVQVKTPKPNSLQGLEESTDAGVIIPSEAVVGLLIRSLAVRDEEVYIILNHLYRFEEMHSSVSVDEQGQREDVHVSPAQVDKMQQLEQENNLAPAMALLNATLQQDTPRSLGITTYNLLLVAARHHAIIQMSKAQQGEEVKVDAVGGVSSAITVYAHMEKSGCLPNARTFQLLLDIYSLSKDLEGAQEVWNEFRSACARGGIEWIADAEKANMPNRQRSQFLPSWSKKARVLQPHEPLSPPAVRSLIGVWTQMIQAHFRCGDAVGALAILEKMMDSTSFAPAASTSTKTASATESAAADSDLVTSITLTPVDVPPPSARTYHEVVKSFMDMGDTATAIAWFKRLLEQTPSAHLDKNHQAPQLAIVHQWDPIHVPPRPSRTLWDSMLQHLYDRGLVREMEDLTDYANVLAVEYYKRNLLPQVAQKWQKILAKTSNAEASKATEEKRKLSPAQRAEVMALIRQAYGRHHVHYDLRERQLWGTIWRSCVAGLEASKLEPTEAQRRLDWTQTRLIDKLFQEEKLDEFVAKYLDPASDASSSPLTPDEAAWFLACFQPHPRSLIDTAGRALRNRGWHAVGMYINQNRLDDAIMLASRLYTKERQQVVAHETGSVDPKELEELGDEPPVEALTALSNLCTLVSGLLERLWVYGSETKQFPSLNGLLSMLRLVDAAGILPPMRAAWYLSNAFLSYRDDPALKSLTRHDWTNLAKTFSATAMSVHYEDNRPQPNPELAWQLVSFLQILHSNGGTLRNLGKNNVYRIYRILQYHLGQAKVDELLQSLGPGFVDINEHLPLYVKKSGVIDVPPDQVPEASAAVQATVDEVRGVTNGKLDMISNSVIGDGQPLAKRSTYPLVISPAQSNYINEGSRSNPAYINGVGGNIPPEVAYERLLAGYKLGDVPAPESIARLIVTLGHSKAKDKVIVCYQIGNEILSTLENNKSWQASAWFALEDAMITALSHCGDIKAASIHRSRLVAQGSAPSANSYGALIANIKDTTDNASVATELFEESRRLGVEPTGYLYNTIISRLAKARKADYAMVLFQAMKTAGLAPTEVTYGAVIAGCARIGDVATAETLFEEMTTLPAYKARIPPFNTMMQLYTHVKPNRERALYYYHLMEQMGVQPTAYTYKLMLDIYGKIEPVDIRKMEEIIDLMKQRGIEITGNHYASIIITHGCSTSNLEAAKGVFDGLRGANRQVTSTLFPVNKRGRSTRVTLPDVIAYEAILAVFLSHHRIDLMQQYFEQMINVDKVRPTAYINNILIKGYASIGNMEAAREVFESMRDPAAGAAAPNNHAPHMTHDGPQLVNGSVVGNVNDPVFREPSSWEAMVRAELSVGDRNRANALLERMKARFYPAAITAKIEGILWEPPQPLIPPRS